MKIICKECGIEFELTKYQEKKFNKGGLIFCSKSCSGKYYANKQHREETIEQKSAKNAKISETLKKKDVLLTPEQKAEKIKRLNSYWKDLTPEERSARNKQNAIKAKQTKLTKYDDENYNNIEQIKETNLARYGVENTYRTETAISKMKAVMQEKYGVDFFFSNREKFEEISLEKYGTKHPMQNEAIKEKLSTTKYLNWGDAHYNNQEQFERTFMERYGVRRPFDVREFKDRSRQTKLEKYGSENYNNREKALKTIYEKYGKDFYEKQVAKLNNRISKVNRKFAEFIGATDFEFPLGRLSYDIKFGNTLIEIDPTFTHNCYHNKLYGKFGDLDADYHYKKTFVAREVGYNCIHVFDWDDWDKIRYILQDKKTLYARNLKINPVSLDEANIFLNKYHLQNTCNGQVIRLGLYKGNELVEIMTFGKPRYNKNYEWELLRLCTHKDYKVVGGAERLFKHFLEYQQPKSIISYCDFSKFSGGVYKRLGFTQHGKPNPSKHWSKGAEHITDNLLRQRGYDQLFGTDYGKGTSNEELMLENGWLPIYDCGQLTFTWKKSS